MKNMPLKNNSNTFDFIPEVDGLRAVAVLGVLLYHFGIKQFSGGFAGVDVFFVISGFLISKIILCDIENGKFTISGFYERRFKRILPALITTFVFTCILFSIVSTPIEFKALQQSLISSLLSISNIYFYYTTDYFNNNTFNPFLHTWSLSVEEQFYMIFPIIIYGLSKYLLQFRNTVILLICITSLVFAAIYSYREPTAAFYLPHLRAWELLIGVTISLLIGNVNLSEVQKTSLSYIGFISILVAFLFFNERMVFPGLSALLPVLGAAFVILGASGSSYVNTFLSSKLMLFLGRISYSLYLIHWPFVCLMSAVGIGLGSKYSIVFLVLSVLFAWLSFMYVEQPFRRYKFKSFRTVSLVSIAGLSFVTVTSIFCVIAIERIWTANPIALAITNVQNYPTLHIGNDHCFLTSKLDDISFYDKGSCLRTNSDKINILLVGDSHSAHYMGAMKKLFPNANILQASASGCLPIFPLTGDRRCTDLMNYIFNQWLPKNAVNLDFLVLSARWTVESSPKIIEINNELSKYKLKTIVIGPSPEYKVPLPKLMGFSALYQTFKPDEFLDKYRFIVEEKFANELTPYLPYFSVIKNICSLDLKSKPSCIYAFQGLPIMFDKDHYTEAGSELALNGLVDLMHK